MREADHDALQFIQEDAPPPPSKAEAEWRILVVDDDPDVHAATAFALREVRILDRPLALLHANSAQQASQLLQREKNIAVVLLDIIMERDDAGFRLIKIIRDDLALKEIRIVLRTGQPGYAPEIQAIRDYDINDYKTKSELTRTKLFTTLTAAIRSYDQICTLNRNRLALSNLLHSVSHLLKEAEPESYAQAAISKLGDILGFTSLSVLCLTRDPPPHASNAHTTQTPSVLVASGDYLPLQGQSLNQLQDDQLRGTLQQAFDSGQDQHNTLHHVSLFRAPHQDFALLIPAHAAYNEDQRTLISLFCSSLAVGLENVRVFNHLKAQAYLDPLTRLPSRTRLIEKLDGLFSSPERTQHTLVLLDIDNFAEVNDTLGHVFGDQLLSAVAERLHQALSDKNLCARVSGDTFAVLGQINEVMPQQVLAIFRDPFLVHGQELMLSATVGIAHLADIDGSGADAVKSANIALRRAKIAARGEYAFYSREMAIEIRERLTLLQSLPQAIERGRMFLMYQPQISLATGKLSGVEALLRWRGDDGRLIAPDHFIPIAEYSGLITHIGDWVMQQAFQQQAGLAKAGYPVRMAVNVSFRQLHHPRFLPMLSKALHESGANPADIELELTESVAMVEPEFIGRMLTQIKALGVSIALDDFGTGFSSLSHLQRLKIDRLKIDRSFVHNLSAGGNAQRIPEIVVQLGQTMDLSIIAEGVETQNQAEALIRLGCHEGQGHLFARPMEAGALLTWLQQHTPIDSHWPSASCPPSPPAV